MEKNIQIYKQIDTTANPAPLGLMAFGMTTVLLNFHNAGFFGFSSMILAMGIFYGGSAQMIAGLMEWKKGNTFGVTAFTSYGFFWLSLVGLIVMPKMGFAAASHTAMAAYFGMWGIFTFGLFIATFKLNKATQVVFLTLTVLLFLLSYAEFIGSAEITKIAGYEGIVCGLSAMYASLAQVINELYGKTVVPLG